MYILECGQGLCIDVQDELHSYWVGLPPLDSLCNFHSVARYSTVEWPSYSLLFWLRPLNDDGVTGALEATDSRELQVQQSRGSFVITR